MNKKKITAKDYFKKDPKVERYYSIFFAMCRKFEVDWAKASEKGKAFIEELTKFNYEREKAVERGLPPNSVQPPFG